MKIFALLKSLMGAFKMVSAYLLGRKLTKAQNKAARLEQQIESRKARDEAFKQAADNAPDTFAGLVDRLRKPADKD